MDYNTFVTDLLSNSNPKPDHELADLVGCEQDPVHHPEGDAWNHTLGVLANARKVLGQVPEADRAFFILVALLHDIGKPLTTKVVDGKVVAYKHGKEGRPLAEAYLRRLGAPDDVVERVLPAVEAHMQCHTMSAEAGDKSWRKLHARFPLPLLALFARCDTFAGKGSLDDAHPGAELIASKVEVVS